MKRCLFFLAAAYFFTTAHTAERRGAKRPATKQFNDCAEVNRRVEDDWNNKRQRRTKDGATPLQRQGSFAGSELEKIYTCFPIASQASSQSTESLTPPTQPYSE